MSYAMAIRIEIYNMVINFGGFDAMNYHVLVVAFKEALYWYTLKKLSNVFFLEYVCSSTIETLVV